MLKTYTARHKKTKKTKDIEIEMSDVDAWEAANPGWEIAITGAPTPGYNLYSVKAPEWMRDKMREIKKRNPGSTIDIK